MDIAKVLLCFLTKATITGVKYITRDINIHVAQKKRAIKVNIYMYAISN